MVWLEHSASWQNDSWGRGFESRWPPHFYKSGRSETRARKSPRSDSAGMRIREAGLWSEAARASPYADEGEAPTAARPEPITVAAPFLRGARPEGNGGCENFPVRWL